MKNYGGYNIRVVQVNADEQTEIRPPRGKRRTYLNIFNDAGGNIFISQNSPVPVGGVGTPVIAASGSRQWGATGQSPEAVPNGSLWIRGSVVAPAVQQVTIEESFC